MFVVVELLQIGPPSIIPVHPHRMDRTVCAPHGQPLGLAGATCAVRTDGTDLKLDVKASHGSEAYNSEPPPSTGDRTPPTIRLIRTHKHALGASGCSTVAGATVQSSQQIVALKASYA